MRCVDFLDFYIHCRVFPLRFAIDITGDRFQNRDEQPGICALRDNGIRKSCRAHGVLAAADPRFGK